MTARFRTKPADFDKKIGLVLQGGGALGSYQAGVYEALAESGYHPDWIAGISIGAINGAIIAGNAPAERVSQLRGFWERVTARPRAFPSCPSRRQRTGAGMPRAPSCSGGRVSSGPAR